MTTEQQLTPVLEHIAADHGDRGQILNLLTARKARPAAIRRRAAIGGSALTVAAAIAVVFTIAAAPAAGPRRIRSRPQPASRQPLCPRRRYSIRVTPR